MKQVILAGTLALTCIACATRSWVVAPVCIDARQPLDAVREWDSADTSQAPREVVHTDPPRLINEGEFSRAMRREYPPDLRALGIGGTTLVHALISEEGCVAAELVRRSSSSAALDSAALRIVRVARFAPAKNRDQTVALWIEMPINFVAR